MDETFSSFDRIEFSNMTYVKFVEDRCGYVCYWAIFNLLAGMGTGFTMVYIAFDMVVED